MLLDIVFSIDYLVLSTFKSYLKVSNIPWHSKICIFGVKIFRQLFHQIIFQKEKNTVLFVIGFMILQWNLFHSSLLNFII